jgi:hypothetical protein
MQNLSSSGAHVVRSQSKEDVAAMQTSKIVEPMHRAELKTKRNLLFAEFLEHPSNTELALEIRSIDDRIAQLAGLSLSRTSDRHRIQSDSHD